MGDVGFRLTVDAPHARAGRAGLSRWGIGAVFLSI